MCGIAGLLILFPDTSIAKARAGVPESWLQMLDRHIRHRGPDGSGRVELSGGPNPGGRFQGTLLHRRLSIIDHVGGHQPMVLRSTPGGPVEAAVVFNGCIYNHRELRTQLTAQGHRFSSDHSDTEVLLHGSARHGPALPSHLDGMFAYAHWDTRTLRLILARDPAGEKPLYYSRFHLADGSSTFTFASTVSAIVSLIKLATGRAPEPDRYRLLRWTLLGFDQHPPFVGIESVMPDQVVVVEPRDKGWHVESASSGVVPSARTLSEGTREPIEAVLSRCVASRLEADVPLGCFLSGGIDSPLIAALAKRATPDLHTFTVRMPDPQYDESAKAAIIAKALGTNHTELECEAHPADDLVMLIAQLGLPLGDSSLLPTHWVSRATRQHAVVALSGDGGDELFGGYRRYAAARWLERFGGWLCLLPDSMLRSSEARSRREMLARLSAAARGWGYADLLAIFPKAEAQRLLPSLAPIGSPLSKPSDPQRSDFDTYLPADLLRKVDTASMAVALEVRAPFLSRELIQRQLRAPASGYGKRELRDLARSILPPGIADEPKSGFAIPVGDWFRSNYGGMRDLLHSTLDDAASLDMVREILPFDHRRVRTLIEEHEKGGRDHSQRLYHLVVLALWSKSL